MRNDRGAAAVFLAFLLFLLIGVAAISLDLARGWNERRLDQTAADLAHILRREREGDCASLAFLIGSDPRNFYA